MNLFHRIGNFFESGKYGGFNILGGLNFRQYKFGRISEKEAVNGFLGNDAVYSIVHKIALNGSTMPYIYKDGEVELPETNDYVKLQMNPSKDFMSRRDFRYAAITNFILTGDLFIEKMSESIGFGVDSLRVYPSHTGTVIREKDGDPFSPVVKYQFDLGGNTITRDADEIIHLSYYDPSLEAITQGQGLSPLQAGQFVLNSNNNLSVAESSMLENRGVSGMISSGSNEYPLTPHDKAALDSGLKDRVGGASKFNGLITVQGSAKYQQFGMSASDMKLIESYPAQLKRLCSLFGFPAELLNAEGSGQFNTRREAWKTSYTEAIIPPCEMIDLAIDLSLQNNFKRPYRACIDRSKIEALNPSKQEQEQNWIAMYREGLVSREWVLEQLGTEDKGQQFVKDFTNGNQRENA